MVGAIGDIEPNFQNYGDLGATGMFSTSYGILYNIHFTQYRQQSIDLTLPQYGPFSQISSYCFEGSFISSIIFPSTISSIQENAFSGCSDLQLLLFEGASQLNYIGSSAFNGCAIETVDLRTTQIQQIGPYAFASNVTSYVLFASTLCTIGSHAFEHCSNLSTISFPDNPNQMGLDIFRNDPITSIFVTSSFSRFNLINPTSMGIPTNLLSSIFTFGPNPNTPMEGYSTYDIYSQLVLDTTTDRTRFELLIRNCPGPITIGNSPDITNLILYSNPDYPGNVHPTALNCIPCYNNSIVAIASLHLFPSVANYLTISLDQSVYFDDGSKLTLVDSSGVRFVPSHTNWGYGNPNYSQRLPIPANIPLGAYGTVFSIFATGSVFMSVVPFFSTANGVLYKLIDELNWPNPTVDLEPLGPFSQISSQAFSGSQLRQITLPSSLSTIQDYAFQDSLHFSSILFEDNCQLTYIGNSALRNCGIQTLDLTFVKLSSIGDRSFASNPINSIVFPSTLTTIHSYAFESCSTLSTITLPDALQVLGVSSLYQTSLYGINVTSTFSNFQLFNQSTIGVPASKFNEIFTFGSNPFTMNLEEDSYVVNNIYALPPIDNPNRFSELVRSYNGFRLYSTINLNLIMTNNSEESLSSNALVQGIGCREGTILPLSQFSLDPTVYNYLPINAGETIYIDSPLYPLSYDGSNVSFQGISGPPSLQNPIVATIGSFQYTIVASGSIVGLATICFHALTKILTDKGYQPVHTLRVGDRVKTIKHGFVPIALIGSSLLYNPGTEERTIDRLYVYTKENHPDVMEDLILTGNHSLLVKKLKKTELPNIVAVLGKMYGTDDHFRLPAYADDRSTPFPSKGIFSIYHFALEHERDTANYGVYANGVLVETSCKAHMRKYMGHGKN